MLTIDQNTKQVGLGFIHGTSDMVLPYQINSLNELLIEVIPCDPLSDLVASRIHIDENTKQCAAGVTNDANETITPLTCDLIVGLPCVRTEIS